MIIICDSCHKTFSYDKYDGFCPHCGAYTSATVQGGKTVIDRNSSGIKLETTPSRKIYSRSAKATRAAAAMDEKTHGHSLKKRIITFAILLILLIGAGIFVLTPGSEEVTETFEYQYAEPGDWLTTESLEVSFGEPEVVGRDEEHGQDLIRVPYEMNYQGNYENVPTVSSVYLYVDGLYINPYTTTSAENSGLVDDSILEQCSSLLNSADSGLLFMIPEDVDHVELYCVLYNKEGHEDMENAWYVEMEVDQ